MREGVRSYSFFCTKKFLEKIFGKWRDERDEHCFYYENLVTLRHVRNTASPTRATFTF